MNRCSLLITPTKIQNFGLLAKEQPTCTTVVITVTISEVAAAIPRPHRNWQNINTFKLHFATKAFFSNAMHNENEQGPRRGWESSIIASTHDFHLQIRQWLFDDNEEHKSHAESDQNVSKEQISEIYLCVLYGVRHGAVAYSEQCW